jgi:hypothetical protein
MTIEYLVSLLSVTPLGTAWVGESGVQAAMQPATRVISMAYPSPSLKREAGFFDSIQKGGLYVKSTCFIEMPAMQW